MWFDIIKVTSEGRLFLFEVFNIPFDADITIPPNLLQSFLKASNENVITEQKFSSLLALSNQGKYQEVVDSLAEMLTDARKERVRAHRQTPEFKEYIKEYGKEYYQRPEVKEKRSEYYRKRRADKKGE